MKTHILNYYLKGNLRKLGGVKAAKKKLSEMSSGASGFYINVKRSVGKEVPDFPVKVIIDRNNIWNNFCYFDFFPFKANSRHLRQMHNALVHLLGSEQLKGTAHIAANHTR